jgi:hypothetical protein
MRNSRYPGQFDSHDSIQGGAAVNFNMVIRYAILALSSALMVLGVIVTAGFMVPRYLPEEYRFLLGIIVFLYGAYRFSVAFFGHRKE